MNCYILKEHIYSSRTYLYWRNKTKSHGYFELLDIVNIGIYGIWNPWKVSPLFHVSNNHGTPSIENIYIYDMVLSDMISKAI